MLEPLSFFNQLLFSLFLLRAFTNIFWGSTLFFFRKSSQQNLFLSCIFLVMGGLLLWRAFSNSVFEESRNIFNVTSYLLMVLVAPFTIFYAYFAIRKPHSIYQKFLHFIPFLVFFFFWLIIGMLDIPHIPPVYTIKELFASFHAYPVEVTYFLLLVLVFLAQVFTYFTIAWIQLVRIRKIYKAHNFSLRPIHYLMIMDWLFLIYPLYGIVYLAVNNLDITIIHTLLVTIVTTILAILNIKLQLPLNTDFSFFSQNQPDKISLLQDAPLSGKMDKLAQDIKDLFEKSEIYKHPQLTIEDLAKQLNTNKTYISVGINKFYGGNFNQLVNSYRILEAQKLLLETEHSVQEIAWNVGFNTRSSFYNAFKEHVQENLSPSEWRKKYRNKSVIE